ncbi:MAG: ATP-dependent helicase C-terminal domain-containing protein [Acidimicrobiales bacterium]
MGRRSGRAAGDPPPSGRRARARGGGGPGAGGEATAAALVARLRAGDAALPWAPATRALRGRLAFAHRLDPDRWPAVDDEALLADADRWLAPLLASDRCLPWPGSTCDALLGRVDPTVVHELDRLAPTSFTAVDGRAIEIAYDDGEPRARARPQRLFGLTRHPTVGGRAQVPVVLELLSPADRPIQVTADLPGFWAGSWSAVRKDLAGRYPKHPWPTDPATASPPAARPRRGPGPGAGGRAGGRGADHPLSGVARGRSWSGRF